jgi:Flp pilus assembly pilin Flp
MKKHFHKKFLRPLFSKKSGQTLVEYALILAFISIVAIAVLKVLGSKVSSVFSKVNQQLDSAQSAS